MRALTGVINLVGVLFALLEAFGLVLCVGGIALVTCLVNGSVAYTGVSRHDDGRLFSAVRFDVAVDVLSTES